MENVGSARELTVDEIAKELKCSVVTVRRQIRKTGKKPVRSESSGGRPYEYYEFVSVDLWKLDVAKSTSARIARTMPTIGQVQFTEGFVNLFGTPEQKAVLEAYKSGLTTAVNTSMEIAAQKVIEARTEALDARFLGVEVVNARIDVQEKADQYLIGQAVLWDMLEYMIEDIDILDGSEFDKVFRKYKREVARPLNINIDRPDDRLVKDAKSRVTIARHEGTFDNEKARDRQGLLEFDIDLDNDDLGYSGNVDDKGRPIPTKRGYAMRKEIVNDVNTEFTDIIAPLALAIAFNEGN
jgi:hypothetical protein